MSESSSTSRLGRPSLSLAERRSELVSLRLTPSELKTVHDQAVNEGTNVSEFVRARSLNRTAKSQQTIPALNREAWLELARTAGNLNQLTAYLHGALPSGPNAATTLIELAAAVAEVRRQLIGAS